MPEPTDYAWAAGFFDGEGCTMAVLAHASRTRNTRYLAISVTQKDTRPLERWKAIFGGTISGPYEGISRWTAQYGRARRVLEALWPYLSEPKREQAIRAEERIVEHNSALGPRASLTEEHRRKIGDAQRGVPKSALHRSRIGDAHRGKPKSPEHRRKLSEAAIRRHDRERREKEMS